LRSEQLVPHAAIDSLEASVQRAFLEQEPAAAVLVGQRQGLQLLHQLAGEVGASIRTSPLEHRGANWDPSCKETFSGVLVVQDGQLQWWQRLRPMSRLRT
jgi:hypothetical protein